MRLFFRFSEVIYYNDYTAYSRGEFVVLDIFEAKNRGLAWEYHTKKRNCTINNKSIQARLLNSGFCIDTKRKPQLSIPELYALQTSRSLSTYSTNILTALETYSRERFSIGDPTSERIKRQIDKMKNSPLW